jgi:hypothetical protein
MACGTGMPTFLQGRVISFFQGVTICLLKETILAGTATAEALIVVMRIYIWFQQFVKFLIYNMQGNGHKSTCIINFRRCML